ncbi:undecaprenyldiphospho-muramoylpentapeptide beta-N-acetylglucosaminyltransferase [Aliifodinibius sp. S!AR15-10]|uniref:undecaprenyldiphospho-muramoylpentapeptide beta-N-acetylglucosaminyltransferase n=1 Tax=Aliifodinibius sp. S!AR15-10 TaxID=2950437 RepID=UPI002855236D|nr:undecaprenyldiphospho-muramoylpentapeptide beta-N-acetylglucosaminyltransferase [Aliifodinibius sp. S!AR15-10]MDR8393887.1 undecaprenyldiphospho-muramoylpentapeptide beta-N-acetylglucosaminyltransferase [Aliifodinibius sp. S!AR15-10]
MHSEQKDISSTVGPTSAAMGKPRVLIAAGGTGGHVYPAIAIADALREECAETEILFVGTENHMEWHAVPEAGYDIKSIWISGFHRRLTLKNLLFPVKLATSIAQSFSIISTFKPDIVVSCGGYVAGPVGWVATKRGVPLVIQEQNSFPGVTNRMLAKSAEVIFTAFKDADQYFPEGETRVSGNPTRSELVEADRQASYESFNFDPQKKTLLVLGGSGGARAINEAMAANVERLHALNLQVIWQCGRSYFDKYRGRIDFEKLPNIRLKDFLKNMDEAYAVADLVVSRAGALSCSELALTGKPSILVPSPNVAGDHQTKNARSMVNEGAAELVTDSELSNTLVSLVEKLINDQERLKQMQKAALKLARPDAANDIAKVILNLTEEKERI